MRLMGWFGMVTGLAVCCGLCVALGNIICGFIHGLNLIERVTIDKKSPQTPLQHFI